MYNYIIGIIDEDSEDIQDIERTIIVNKPENIAEEQIAFNSYTIPVNTSGLSNDIANAVINDIVNDKIQVLIVDYKIIVSTALVEGTEIFRRISETVPKFPIIILTNVPEDCYKKEFVDADKVYSKGRFFKLEENYSKEKTLNIFRNMDNYMAQRAKLSTKLANHLSLLETQGYSVQTLKDIIETEKLLDDFFPQQQSTVEKELNVSDLKNAVELLREANDLLGGQNEN